MLVNFLSALALVFVIEGLIPFTFPRQWKKLLRQIIEKDDNALRTMGFITMILGLILLTVIHQFVD